MRAAAAITLEKLGWKPDLGEDGAWYWIAQKDWERCIIIGTPAVNPLIVALNDEEGWVRIAAAKALGDIGDARAVGPLIAVLKDRNEDIRNAASDALGMMGPPAIDPLIALLRDLDKDIRKAAAIVLKKIYHNGRLDQQAKNKILIRESVMAQPHEDNYESLLGSSSSDCSSSVHTDSGIGVIL